jgi:hypothetical protein
LNGEANRVRKKQSSAIIAADVSLLLQRAENAPFVEQRCAALSSVQQTGHIRSHSLLGGLALSSFRLSIGTKNPIPEEMDHREIAVRVPVMNEVQFLFPSEPCKPFKSRSLCVPNCSR